MRHRCLSFCGSTRLTSLLCSLYTHEPLSLHDVSTLPTSGDTDGLVRTTKDRGGVRGGSSLDGVGRVTLRTRENPWVLYYQDLPTLLIGPYSVSHTRIPVTTVLRPSGVKRPLSTDTLVRVTEVTVDGILACGSDTGSAQGLRIVETV